MKNDDFKMVKYQSIIILTHSFQLYSVLLLKHLRIWRTGYVCECLPNPWFTQYLGLSKNGSGSQNRVLKWLYLPFVSLFIWFCLPSVLHFFLILLFCMPIIIWHLPARKHCSDATGNVCVLLEVSRAKPDPSLTPLIP